MAETVRIEPLVAWPREATAGESYLMTVDVRLAPGSQWRYDAEEFPVLCVVSSGPSCTVGPVGEPAVLLHRFGGTYGPAQFLLTARDVADDPGLRLTLVNQAGVPIAIVPLEMRIVGDEPAPPVETVRIAAARLAAGGRSAVDDFVARAEGALDDRGGVVLVVGGAKLQRTALAHAFAARRLAPAVFAGGRGRTPFEVLSDLYTQSVEQSQPPPTDPRALLTALERAPGVEWLVIDGLSAGASEELISVLLEHGPIGVKLLLTSTRRERIWASDDVIIDVGGDPEATRAYRAGVAAWRAGEVDDALTAFERAAALGDPAGANNLGILRRDLGDLPGAVEAWRIAARVGHAAGANNLGIALRDRGDTRGAEAAWRAASELGHPAGANNLGNLLRRNGDLDGAQAAWRRAAALGHPAASRNLEELARRRVAGGRTFKRRDRTLELAPPDLTAPFIDRMREQATLRNLIRAGEAVAVLGPPGIGKTALVHNVLRDATLGGHDGMVWLHAGGRAVEELMAEVFESLFEGPGVPTPAERRTALRDVDLLVVVDDIDAAFDVARLRDWMPRSRYVFIGRELRGTEPLELGPLPWEAIEEYLVWDLRADASVVDEARENVKTPHDLWRLVEQLKTRSGGEAFEALIEGAVRALAAATGTDYNQIFLTGERRGERMLVAVADALAEDKQWYRFADLEGLIGTTLRAGETINAPDVHRREEYIPAEPKTRSELAVPVVMDDGTVVGVLNSESASEGHFGASIEAAVTALANSLGRSLGERGWSPETPVEQLPFVHVHLRGE